jgi:hypothetical protein
MSITSRVGLVGVSRKNVRVLGRTASRHWSAGAEQRLGRDKVVAGLELSHQCGSDGSHAAGRRARRLRLLECGHPRLEHRDGRIRKTGIEKAGLVPLEAGFALLGTLVDEALSQEHRLRVLSERRAQRAGVNEPCLRAIARGGGGRGHGASFEMGQQKPGRPAGSTPGRIASASSAL